MERGQAARQGLVDMLRSLPGSLRGGSSSQELSSFCMLENRGPEKGNDSDKASPGRRAGLGLEPELLRPAFLPLLPTSLYFSGCLSAREGLSGGFVVGPLEKLFSNGMLNPFGDRCRFFQNVRPEGSRLGTGKGAEEDCQSRESGVWTEKEQGVQWACLAPQFPAPGHSCRPCLAPGSEPLFQEVQPLLTQFLVSKGSQPFSGISPRPAQEMCSQGATACNTSPQAPLHFSLASLTRTPFSL